MTGRNAFWEYSLRFYSEPDMERWCLWLQDQHGANVSLVLFCCYAGVCGVTLDRDTFARLLGPVRAWDENVVQPLRAVRRALRDTPLAGDPVAIGQMVLNVELAAERQVQDDLAKWLAEPERCCDKKAERLIISNLQCYLAILSDGQGTEARSVNVAKLTDIDVIQTALRAGSDIFG